MKAKELRIGNLILGEYYDDQDIECEETVKFLGYAPSDNWYWVEGSIESYSSFNPIPLTEEWLARFGFVKCFYEEGGLRLPWYKLRKNDCLFEIDYEFSYTRDDGGYIKIQHVHSLQNLYFALTGEELTLQEL